MIAIVDVDYRDEGAVAACVLVRKWGDADAEKELVETIVNVESYVPGEFYRRELPCLLAVLAKAGDADLVVIDGYVWLGLDRPGLGAHLYDALKKKAAIVGVAKTRFHGADAVALPVLRGGSRTPLWITAAGIDVQAAGDALRSMHGPHRIPALIKRADQLCRGTIKDL